MCNRIVKNFLVAATLLVASSVPAFAQQAVTAPAKLGVGISFLGDDGGVGVAFDYSRPFRTLEGNKSLGWVVDLGFNRNSFDGGILGDDFDSSVTNVMVQGGVRMNGQFNEKLSWHGQGLIGIMRSSYNNDELDDACDLIDEDCDLSDTSFVFTPGVGVDYSFKDNMAARAQLDFPLNGDGNTTRFWFGLSWLLGR